MSPHIPPAVRDRIRAGAQSSAVVLADLIVREFDPASVIDVGCGENWLAKSLLELEVDAFGVDGDMVGADRTVDLASPPYPKLGPFDVATCLEVAEHVDQAHADELVGWLCSLAPIVVFSAAVPGQGGDHHVNEQWPAYWAARFKARGYNGTGVLREQIWDDDRVEPWYRQNLLVFGKPTRIAKYRSDGCRALVHPVMWTDYR